MRLGYNAAVIQFCGNNFAKSPGKSWHFTYKNFLELLMGRNYASLTFSYSWEGLTQNMPPVTLGEELCNICFA